MIHSYFKEFWEKYTESKFPSLHTKLLIYLSSSHLLIFFYLPMTSPDSYFGCYSKGGKKLLKQKITLNFSYN